MMDSDWIEYNCKSGKTVFLYNKVTGEHKWPPGCDNGPPEDSIMYGQPVEYKVLISISTQTDDYGCDNGCSSMYINTHVTNITETLPQPQPGVAADDGGKDREEQCQSMNVVIYNRSVLTDDRENHDQNKYQRVAGKSSLKTAAKPAQDIIKQEITSEDLEELDESEGESQSSSRRDASQNVCTDRIFAIPSMSEKEEYFSGYHIVQNEPVVCYTDSDNLHSEQFRAQQSYSLQNKSHVDNVDSNQPNKEGHVKEVLICSYCSKPFKCQSALTVHIRMHTGESPFECPHCDKKCKQQSDLNKHLKTHTKEKPFACSYCGKGFGRKDHLNEHITTHTGVKQFECYFCKKRFAQKSNLNGHLKLHTGLKPFECTVCGKAFAEKGNLKKHYMTHTGEKPFKCSFCSRKFARRQDMEAHRTIHTGLKQFECPHCQLQFRQKKTLNKHLDVHMSEPVPVAISVNCIAVNIEETCGIQTEKRIKESNLIEASKNTKDSNAIEGEKNAKESNAFEADKIVKESIIIQAEKSGKDSDCIHTEKDTKQSNYIARPKNEAVESRIVHNDEGDTFTVHLTEPGAGCSKLD